MAAEPLMATVLIADGKAGPLFATYVPGVQFVQAEVSAARPASDALIVKHHAGSAVPLRSTSTSAR